jgi:uncharacterized protein
VAETISAPKKTRKARPWQFYTILLHRYLGYFFLGITVVYALSGLAVNHVDQWNPNYITQTQHVQIPALKDSQNLSEAEARVLYLQLGVQKPFNPQNVFYPDPESVEILLSENDKIKIHTATGMVEREQIKRRPVLHLLNALHLNEPKKAWTLYADAYAIGLLLLALTGLFMKKGKKGLWGEAGIWTVAGMILPVALILLYYR